MGTDDLLLPPEAVLPAKLALEPSRGADTGCNVGGGGTNFREQVQPGTQCAWSGEILILVITGDVADDVDAKNRAVYGMA